MRPEWYLEEVQDLKNRQWELKEKAIIYTLREEYSVSIQHIATAFDASKTQIYNILAYYKKHLKNCCKVCGKKLRNNKPGLIKICSTCQKKIAKYKADRRKAALKENWCPNCHDEYLIPGRTSCKKCISATHRRRYKINMCGKCGKNPIAKDSIALCEKCKKINLQLIRRKRKCVQKSK